MSEIIFHHYPQSPVAEKVRTGFGIKQLTWRSVDIPRIPPKPDLMPLTGGYRRTPVLQIGADIYCDSQGILRELDRRSPEPSFSPGGADGLSWGLSRWTDGALFTTMIKLVLSATVDTIPEAFSKDRSRLYLGQDTDLHDVAKDTPHLVSQMHAQFGWMNQGLVDGRKFLLGDAPGLPDVLCYYLVWFLRGRWEQGPAFLAELPELEAWETRIREIGHGSQTEMSATEALEVAKAAEPAFPAAVDANDPMNLVAGQSIGVVPEEDGGDPVVEGKLHILNRDTVALLRQDERIGNVCVHFPRAGYRIIPG